jgi:TrmH family RNA methyltransferase
MSLDSLRNIRFVLVEPSHPGNIGAVARAMKTMGLSRLALVRPEAFPSAEATARASGADDVLYHAALFQDLPSAVADCVLTVGTSARQRTLEWPELSPREAAPVLLEAAAQGPVAVVLGRESSGLTNAELERCQHLLRIPANPEYSSLNLAAAAQVVAYELRVAALGAVALATGGRAGAGGEGRENGAVSLSQGPAPPEGEGVSAATAAELEGLLTHLEETARAIGFLDPAAPRYLMRRLWRLFHRARLDRTEVNILRGFLKAVLLATRRDS